MTRTAARELAVHLCYELSFSDLSADVLLAERLTPEAFALWQEEDALYAAAPGPTQIIYIEGLVRGVAAHEPELDAYIERYAVGWDFGRIPRVAVSVMKVCMYEILYMPDIPPSAAINEAVELAKKYEDARVVSFLNGILGSFSRKEVPTASATEESATEKSAPEEFAAGESATEASAPEGSATEGVVAGEPATEASATEDPATEDPATENHASEENPT